MSLSEKEIQNQILEYLNCLPNCKAWTNQSVGIFDPVRKVYRRQSGKYGSRGVADIIGIWWGRMLCIEVKSKTGVVQPHQKEFLEDMRRFGAIAFVARSLDDVVKVIRETKTRIESPVNAVKAHD